MYDMVYDIIVKSYDLIRTYVIIVVQGFRCYTVTMYSSSAKSVIYWSQILKNETFFGKHESVTYVFIAPNNTTRRLPSCYAHTARAPAPPNPVMVVGGCSMVSDGLVDTMVEQSLVSSAEETRGRECVRVEDGSPRGGQGVGWRDG